MVAESVKTFRGVLCTHCNEPISIPHKMVSLQDEIEHGETHAPRAFSLRCLLCEYEDVYTIGEIKEFEGVPRLRTPRGRAAIGG